MLERAVDVLGEAGAETEDETLSGQGALAARAARVPARVSPTTRSGRWSGAQRPPERALRVGSATDGSGHHSSTSSAGCWCSSPWSSPTSASAARTASRRARARCSAASPSSARSSWRRPATRSRSPARSRSTASTSRPRRRRTRTRSRSGTALRTPAPPLRRRRRRAPRRAASRRAPPPTGGAAEELAVSSPEDGSLSYEPPALQSAPATITLAYDNPSPVAAQHQPRGRGRNDRRERGRHRRRYRDHRRAGTGRVPLLLLDPGPPRRRHGGRSHRRVSAALPRTAAMLIARSAPSPAAARTWM